MDSKHSRRSTDLIRMWFYWISVCQKWMGTRSVRPSGVKSLRVKPSWLRSRGGEKKARLKSMQAGFDDHLVKPVSVDDVMEVLTRLAEQAASG